MTSLALLLLLLHLLLTSDALNPFLGPDSSIFLPAFLISSFLQFPSIHQEYFCVAHYYNCLHPVNYHGGPGKRSPLLKIVTTLLLNETTSSHCLYHKRWWVKLQVIMFFILFSILTPCSPSLRPWHTEAASTHHIALTHYSSCVTAQVLMVTVKHII